MAAGLLASDLSFSTVKDLCTCAGAERAASAAQADEASSSSSAAAEATPRGAIAAGARCGGAAHCDRSCD